jgi:hypothetical protein
MQPTDKEYELLSLWNSRMHKKVYSSKVNCLFSSADNVHVNIIITETCLIKLYIYMCVCVYVRACVCVYVFVCVYLLCNICVSKV